MTIHADPEQNELNSLLALADLNGKEVLEIGCGDGRLTQLYAGQTANVVAVDPFEPAILQARAKLPEHLQDRVEFHAAQFEGYAAAAQSACFDTAIFSWSL